MYTHTHSVNAMPLFINIHTYSCIARNRYARKKQSLLDTYTPEKRAEMKKQGPQILDLTKKPEPRFADRKPKPIRVGGGEGTDSDDGTTVESEYDLDAEVHTVFGGIPMHDRTLNDEAFVIRPAPNQDIYDIIPDYNVKLKKLRALKRKQQQEEKKERGERREEK